MSQAEQRDFMRTFVKNQKATLLLWRNQGGINFRFTSEDVENSKESEVVEEMVKSSERTPRKRSLLLERTSISTTLTYTIETGDPDAEHKMCLKYASDEEDDSDCDTLVLLYAVVDWEWLPTGL
ncbi:hypothetical protein Tco_0842309 [Tanacetum coccineum]|uniref:Uncharacterized protein n=1 Tax=Tanacetum coccineum TaxID=301880 RepID=A0ABQ5B127_9ASTR